MSNNRILLYIAGFNGKGLSELIERVSKRPAGRAASPQHLASIAERVGKEYGDEFYQGLAEIHPDKDFILDAIADSDGSSLPYIPNGREKGRNVNFSGYSNACGCQQMMNADGSKTIMPCGDHAFMYASGNNQQPQQQTQQPQSNDGASKQDSISTLAIVAITVSIGILALGIIKTK